MTTHELQQDRDRAFSRYLTARKAGQRDRAALLALIAITRAWHQSKREDAVIDRAKDAS